jgi:hypothetical protein
MVARAGGVTMDLFRAGRPCSRSGGVGDREGVRVACDLALEADRVAEVEAAHEVEELPVGADCVLVVGVDLGGIFVFGLGGALGGDQFAAVGLGAGRAWAWEYRCGKVSEWSRSR